MDILRIRHSWPEPSGFDLSRPEGSGDYVLLHFHNAVDLDFPGQHIVTKPGALIVFSPDTGHRFRSHGPLLHDWMHLTGDVAEQLAKYGLLPDRVYQPSCGHLITEMTAQLEAEFFAGRPYWREQSRHLLVQLFIALARDLMGGNPVPVDREMVTRLRELRAALLLHPEQPWTADAMAARLGISSSRLYPLYKRMFAISPGQDLILIRVEKAKNLLHQGESVERTAEVLGYASVHHFIRQFRQVTGCTPGQIKAHLGTVSHGENGMAHTTMYQENSLYSCGATTSP